MSAGRTFLLVEDDAYEVLFMEIEFQRAHTHVQFRVVKDGVEAQHYLAGEGDYHDRRKHPLPDVILLDVQMPRLDGFEFLTWLRSLPDEAARCIPVVVLSTSGRPEHVTRAYELGANGYLVKAFDWHEFREQIRGLSAFWGVHAETGPVYAR
jgi:CheY-like chemotaxis protein